MFKVGTTKNLNKDYEANRQGNHRHLEIYKVFPGEPKRVGEIMSPYENKHIGKGWYKIDTATVEKIIGLMRTDVVVKKGK